MKVNVGIEISDDDRKVMAEKLGKSGLATRNDVREFVTKSLEDFINGQPPVAEDDAPVIERAPQERTADFKASRGDEPYLFKAKDQKLREIHSRMLDTIEEYESYVWQLMENNRQ